LHGVDGNLETAGVIVDSEFVADLYEVGGVALQAVLGIVLWEMEPVAA
jgi:hypothetical protein